MDAKYVFIVGLPRTGTKLMVNILKSSSEGIYICPETAFLGNMVSTGLQKKIRKIGNMTNDTNVFTFVDYIFSGRLERTYWKHLNSGKLNVNKSELLERIIQSDRSNKAIFQILMDAVPDAHGKNIIGERTPSHLYHVPTLLKWFPGAKIIHTYRDPRAVFVSELFKAKKRNKATIGSEIKKPRVSKFIFPLVFIHMSIATYYSLWLHKKYSKKYPNSYYISFFEDLVTQPDIHIKKICNFLEISFEKSMLKPKVVDSSYATKYFDSGFDPSSLSKWKYKVNPIIISILNVVLKIPLLVFGYPK